MSYTSGYKLKVIKFAREHGNRAVQRQFGVDESCVRVRRKKEKMLRDAKVEKSETFRNDAVR